MDSKGLARRPTDNLLVSIRKGSTTTHDAVNVIPGIIRIDTTRGNICEHGVNIERKRDQKVG